MIKLFFFILFKIESINKYLNKLSRQTLSALFFKFDRIEDTLVGWMVLY